MNNNRRYYLSLFYAREKWAELIAEIMLFCRERQNYFCDYLISFSEERGEHLRTVFVSPQSDCDYTDEIQNYFQTFFDQNPSVRKTSFPYGRAVWCTYPNNSLAWNIFKLPDYSEEYINFHQRTMDAVLKLLEDDFSSDSILSLGIYLFTKGLAHVDEEEQKNILLRTLHDVSEDIENYSFINTVKELIDEIDINEVNEAVQSYWNENESEYSPELIHWLTEVRNFLKFSGYKRFCSIVCEILGLNGLHQMMVLELINTGYNSYKMKIANE